MSKAELLTLPLPVQRDLDVFTRAAIAAGETLADMAAYWAEAMPEERRDIVWALLNLNGMVYDLKRGAIIGLYPRQDVLPVLLLGLDKRWMQQEGGLWLHPDHLPPFRPVPLDPHKGYQQPSVISPEQERTIVALLREGHNARWIAKQMGVSYWGIWRLMQREVPKQVQPGPRVLTPTQAKEAKAMVRAGMSLRKVAHHFGVSHGAIWRLMQTEGGDGKRK